MRGDGMSASGGQALIGHHDAPVRVTLPLQLRESECSISARCFTKIAMSCAELVSSLLTRALFKRGGLRYSAPLGFSTVLHKEIDVAATIRSRHESDPPPFAVLTGSGLLGSAQARAA